MDADHTIHLVRGSAPSNPPPAATNENAPRASADTAPGSGTGRDTAAAAAAGGFGGAAGFFPGLGSGPVPAGLFGTGFPEFDQVQQQLTQNPNMMREIMNLPAIQNLMNNPDLMRNLIMANPQMREIIDRNPDLAHILNDPSTLRQTLEAARNPELMREMMRNTDRAMSNIESSPEGFNMLRRMYQTVQEPFLNATTMGADGGGGGAAASNPFAALLGAQNRDRAAATRGTTESPAPNTNPLPNPWGAPGMLPRSRFLIGGCLLILFMGIGGTTRAPPAPAAAETRMPGLGGMGLPDMEQMMDGMQDPAMMNQMMQNPAVSQIMQSMLSNPQYMNQVGVLE